MKKYLVLSVLVAALVQFSFSGRTGAFTGTGEGCGAGECVDCHSLDRKEAADILEGLVDEVGEVEFAEVPGLWMVEVKKDGQNFLIYLDFSKSYLISGNILRISTKENVTRKKIMERQRVDPKMIPLDDALLLGLPSAKRKIIVFTDPQCPYCIRLHEELKKAVEADSDIAFYIKLFPLQKLHPDAYRISRSIVCEGSLPLLEVSLAGGEVPDPTCDTTVVDETIKLARELNIRSTPTLIFPDGRVVSGFKTADEIVGIAATPSPNQGN